MLKITFWDTETTGLVEWKKPNNHPDQPDIVQIAMLQMLFNPNTFEHRVLNKISVMVQTDKPISDELAALHGTTKDMSSSLGIPQASMVRLFKHFHDRSDILVAHNKSFDMRMMKIAALRQVPDWTPFVEKEHHCTKAMTEKIVRLPPTEKMISSGLGNKFKAPKLSEAYLHFFGESLEGAHDALVDTEGCARVYFHVKQHHPAGR